MNNIEEIVEKCLKGDIRSQNDLYAFLYNKMYNTCYKYFKTEDATNDVLQEGITMVFINLHKYSTKGKFDGWAYRVILNRCKERKRRAVHVFYPGEDKIPSRNQHYTDNIESKLFHEQILSEVQKLPPGYRSVFQLYAIYGYDHEEISRKLGISEGTSKSQLSRARRKLQNYIKNNS